MSVGIAGICCAPQNGQESTQVEPAKWLGWTSGSWQRPTRCSRSLPVASPDSAAFECGLQSSAAGACGGVVEHNFYSFTTSKAAQLQVDLETSLAMVAEVS